MSGRFRKPVSDATSALIDAGLSPQPAGSGDATGRVIGYTTGVYDLFHIGHLNLLRKAGALCDYLIVGVTTDELCLARKGKLPVIPFDERVEIVRALRFVGDVVPQADMDKYAAWQRHLFHKMFVGDDWKGHPNWVKLEDRLGTHGVEIIYFPYTSHVSTSHLRDVLSKGSTLDRQARGTGQ